MNMKDMNVRLAQLYAVLVGALAIAGLFAQGHLFDLMNVDTTLDLLRIVLAASLIYAGFISKSERTASMILAVVGILYIGMGLVGLASPTLGGMLPSGLTGFDIFFHLATGVVAAGAGLRQVMPRTSSLSHS